MNTTRVLSETDNSKIKIDKFEVTIKVPLTFTLLKFFIKSDELYFDCHNYVGQVEFKHANAKLDVKGLGGKIIQKLSNSVSPSSCPTHKIAQTIPYLLKIGQTLCEIWRSYHYFPGDQEAW